ncbi:MAG: DUF433 domain-containing protein [Actinobacteria bacterium]|nr:DUF433 domain-containing protein [Actinomycetota bacterium]
MIFDRISSDPRIMAGSPVIRGMRIPVATVVRMAAAGLSSEQICDELPDLEPEDVSQSLSFAAAVVADHVVELSA